MQRINVGHGFRQDFAVEAPSPGFAPQAETAIGVILDGAVRTTDFRKLGIPIHPIPLAGQFNLFGCLNVNGIASGQ